ncbi:MAG: GNAT family N-acetyltransferase [Leptospirales bacterium]|nr:GNAT family N-acetyltransferase [Leptospirales bacterium]
MILETERLILRPWTEDDAEPLYEYAKDPRVGPSAGWLPHVDVDESRQVIRDILTSEETYAVVLKSTGEPVGSIGLMIGNRANLEISANEGEIGYWIAVPYWGQGLIPEGVREVIRHAFADLGLSRLWCGYFDGNKQSRRVQEKCGFLYHHTINDVPVPLLREVRIEHVSSMSKAQWDKSAGK